MTDKEMRVIRDKAHEAIKGLPVHVYIGANIFMDTLQTGPSFVKMEVLNRGLLAGGEPPRKELTKAIGKLVYGDAAGKVKLKKDYLDRLKAWEVKAKLEAEELM